ncbi:MAG: hypothetical protein R8F63_00855 [Acidimicrobiales bacterium]|nr:hypothetical protein [Acidimicrobiales bacterium]
MALELAIGNQEEYLPLVVAEHTGEHILEQESVIDGAKGRRLIGVAMPELRVDWQRDDPSSGVEATVADDAIEPGIEARVRAKLAAGSPGPKQCLLDDVFGAGRAISAADGTAGDAQKSLLASGVE